MYGKACYVKHHDRSKHMLVAGTYLIPEYTVCMFDIHEHIINRINSMIN